MADNKARKTVKDLEAQSRDVAYKIWLAGIGAYGRAFDEAKDNVENFSENSAELFDDLVKRGSAIESDIKARLESNDRFADANERITKAVETAAEFQEKQRERFEARMERMRDLLGLSAGSDFASKLHAQTDKIEDAVADLRAKATGAAGSKALTARLDKLKAEIEAIAKANAPAAKAKPKTRAKAAAKKAVAKKKKTTKKS